MPRIATALWVVAAISVSIGVNTYRYPVVREMAAATPRIRLPAAPATKAEPSPAPSAAADPSRSAPAKRRETTAQRPKPPMPKSGSRPQSSKDAGKGSGRPPAVGHVSKVPRKTPPPAASPPPELPREMPRAGPALGGKPPVSQGAAAEVKPPSGLATAGEPNDGGWPAKRDASSEAAPPFGDGAAAKLPTEQAASASKPAAAAEPRPWRPLARLTASAAEQVAIPTESGGLRPEAPDASKPDERDNGVKRLPPVDRVWQGNVRPADADQGQIPPYPHTNVE